MVQTHGQGILRSCFSSLPLFVGLGSISRVLLLCQKTNAVRLSLLWDAIYVGCHFFEVVFLIGGVPFWSIVSMGDINVVGFSHFDQASLFYVTLHGHPMFCNLQNTNLQSTPRRKTIRRLCLEIQFSAIFT